MQIGRRKLLGGLVGAVGAVLVGKTSAIAKTSSPLLIGQSVNPTTIAEVESLELPKTLVATISVDTTEFEAELDRLQKTLERLQENKAVVFPASTQLTEISRDNLPMLVADRPIFEFFPAKDSNSFVVWEQADNYTGDHFSSMSIDYKELN